MKSIGRPIFGALRGRTLSQAACADTERVTISSPVYPQITKLQSGAMVATLESSSPIARVGFFLNAGARNETGANVGVTHALRAFSNLSTQNNSDFALTRTIQQMGGSFTCSTSREHMIYSLSCRRDLVEAGVDILGDIVTRPAFKPWEVQDASSRLNLDLALLDQQPQVQLMEGLHKAAFRGTLGRSLYSPANRVGSHSPEMLYQFVKENYGTNNMAVVGFGVDHDALVSRVNKLQSVIVAAPCASTYYGGEFRLDIPSPLTHAAIVTKGVKLGDEELLAVGVLQRIMGTGPYVKYSSNVCSSKVNKAAACGTSGPFAASCISASYSDNGLFGFNVVAQPSDMATVLKALVNEFSAATQDCITEADVEKAKNQLRAAVAMEMESGAAKLEDMGVQCSFSENIISLDTIEANINKITLSHINAVAKKVINSGRPTMAAVGDLSNTPYLDQLL